MLQADLERVKTIDNHGNVEGARAVNSILDMSMEKISIIKSVFNQLLHVGNRFLASSSIAFPDYLLVSKLSCWRKNRF